MWTRGRTASAIAADGDCDWCRHCCGRWWWCLRRGREEEVGAGNCEVAGEDVGGSTVSEAVGNTERSAGATVK